MIPNEDQRHPSAPPQPTPEFRLIDAVVLVPPDRTHSNYIDIHGVVRYRGQTSHSQIMVTLDSQVFHDLYLQLGQQGGLVYPK
jgi:hypothetical protein